MGFVKGVIAGVLGVAGIFVTAAVIDVVKDEKKRKEDMDRFKKDLEKDRAEHKKEDESETDFYEKVGKVFENIKKNRSGVIHCAM